MRIYSSLFSSILQDFTTSVFVCLQFGTDEQVNCEKLDKWLLKHCPNMFSGVHSWVCMVLGGSNLPAEMVRKEKRKRRVYHW